MFKTGGGITEADFWPKVLKTCPQSKSSAVFTDFGSEYFFQALLCALLGDFQEVVGIELDEESFEKSVQLAKHFVYKAETENKFIPNIMLIHGDFLKHDAWTFVHFQELDSQESLHCQTYQPLPLPPIWLYLSRCPRQRQWGLQNECSVDGLSGTR